MSEPLATEPDHRDLESTAYLDFTHPDVATYAESTTDGLATEVDKAVALFVAVRDGWRYDPYDISSNPADYRASSILAGSRGWCVTKTVLLAALARSCGIPARLGFADVKNHLRSNKLAENMQSDVFAWHAYGVLWLEGAWRKASPAFNRELCERFGVKLLEFDGRSDALLHAFDEAGNLHMEYVNDRGVYRDLPFEEIMATFADIYPGMVNRNESEFDPDFHSA